MIVAPVDALDPAASKSTDMSSCGVAVNAAVGAVPLPAGTSAEEYRRRFEAVLDEALEDFAPELVFVSAGFDVLAGDPLGGLELEPADLHALTVHLIERTRATAEGRVIAVLEGGYAPDRVGAGTVDVIRALAGLAAKD